MLKTFYDYHLFLSMSNFLANNYLKNQNKNKSIYFLQQDFYNIYSYKTLEYDYIYIYDYIYDYI